jgi:hypothetical protein
LRIIRTLTYARLFTNIREGLAPDGYFKKCREKANVNKVEQLVKDPQPIASILGDKGKTT